MKTVGYIKNILEHRGFGFIRDENHNEFFFHRDDCESPWGDIFEATKPGNRVYVEFDYVDSPKGLRAVAVSLAAKEN